MEINTFKKANLTEDDLKGRLKKNSKNKIMTGIKVIDDVFGGIKPNDIVLVGAKTGVGKSSIVSDVAENAGNDGKRVHIFSLESEEKELEMRIAFKKIAKKTDKKIYYKKWYDNQYPELEPLYAEALKEINESNIHVYYRSKEFGINDFTKQAMLIKDETDLIIIDHIHYFDFDGNNENKELGGAIKKIRDIALLTGVPIIIVAHLRKEMGVGKQQKLMPEIDDFHGSSDLSKICTKAVMISSRRSSSNSVSRTFFHFPKFRQFGSARNYIFGCDYSLTANQYSDKYDVYYFKQNDISALNNLDKADREDLGWLG